MVTFFISTTVLVEQYGENNLFTLLKVTYLNTNMYGFMAQTVFEGNY